MRRVVRFTALGFILGATLPEPSAAAEAGYTRLRMVEIEDAQGFTSHDWTRRERRP